MARRERQQERPIPAHPYRDTALVYGCMAGVLLVVAAVTGGDLIRAVIAAVVFFAVATAWTCWRFRMRIKARDAARAAEAETSSLAPSGLANGNGRGRMRPP